MTLHHTVAGQASRRVGVLLMDKAGSVGLDLSFVPHLFLMEPFLDGALEEQVPLITTTPCGASRRSFLKLTVPFFALSVHILAAIKRFIIAATGGGARAPHGRAGGRAG